MVFLPSHDTMIEYPWPSESVPPIGREVLVTLADNSRCLAMYANGKWFIGVDNNAQDAELQGTVKSWGFCSPEKCEP